MPEANKEKKPMERTTHSRSTLFVREVPETATSAELEEFFANIGPVRSCFVVSNKEIPGKNLGYGFVQYAMPEDASRALEELNDTAFPNEGGSPLTMAFALRKRKDGEEATEEPKGKKEGILSGKKKDDKSKGEEKDPLAERTLIIRNLPASYKENDLRAMFAKFGPVSEAHIPTKPSKFPGGAPISRGFGFVQFVSKADATMALGKMNGHKLMRREIVVDWALSKDTFEAAEAQEETKPEEKKEEENDDTMEDVEEEEEEEEEEEGEDVYMDLNSTDEEDEEDDDNDDDKEQEEEKEVTKKVNDRPPSPETGCTLFIRNLSYDTKQDELYTLFKSFGPLRYCRITLDRESGMSRGTGFVCFWRLEDATQCLKAAEAAAEAAPTLKAMVGPTTSATAYAKSVLQAEAPVTGGGQFIIHDRLLALSVAVPREEASKLAEVGQRKREREDRRNIYLLREGLITSKSEAAKSMTELEIRKRDASFTARKKLLANNPDLYVSKKRLSIRNLPVRVDDDGLRKLATSAIDKFKAQVREGVREHLSPSEREEGWDKRARVTQAKVIRSKDRVDAASGLSRSKGYAFVEFTTHSHSLAALRYLNNNPDLFGDPKRLLVEFSLENSQVVKRREERR
ncbi:hypothetical protein BJ684DRAFT_12385, partial [Piptocephalis cylindrospora]